MQIRVKLIGSIIYVIFNASSISEVTESDVEARIIAKRICITHAATYPVTAFFIADFIIHQCHVTNFVINILETLII